MPNVSNIVKTIQDIMRKDAGTYGDAQRLEQLGWMFFLKIFDDREQELELIRDSYRSPLPKHLRWSTWATDEEGITGDALLDFVNNTLLPKLKSLNGSGNRISGLIRMTFEDANNYMKNGTLMRQVINKINGIDFNASDDRHMFGDIYEKILKDLQSAGNAGEFYTPRAVTQFIVEQVNPQLGESVLDPACGTGGFLVCAIEHLRKQAKTEADERTIQDCFFGIEKKHLPHVLCMTNLLLHGIDVPSTVRHDNTLARPLRDWSPKERVDVVVTNPPFGGMEEDGIEANFPAEFRTRETADLFLVLIMKLLKPGGRAGIVLPDGTLFGEGVKTRIKESLLTDCNLHTVIRLPAGVFSPYTSIRTNLLFFTKGVPTDAIWYYEHPYPAGVKIYNKGTPIRIDEFQPERDWWGTETNGFADRVENERAWRVSLEELRSTNFNLDIPNPHGEDSRPGDLDALLPEYETCLSAIAQTQSALRHALNGVRITTASGRTIDKFIQSVPQMSDPDAVVASIERLVLQLATQGRLSEGSDDDEPVSAFLGRIWSDPADPRTRTPVASGAHPFDIPSRWAWVTLAEIAPFAIGKTPPRGDPRFWDPAEHPWVSIADMTHYGSVESTKEMVSDLAANQVFRQKWAEPDSVLMSFKLTIGKVARTSIRCFHNEAIISLKPPESELRDYLFRFLPVFASLQKSVNAIKGSTLNKGLLTAMPIALPPLQEQRRLTSRVDDVLALLSDLDSQLHHARHTGTSVVDAFVSELLGQE